MDKVIIGDTTYMVDTKVKMLIDDLVDKNDRMRARAKRAYTDGIIWGAEQYGGMIIHREDIGD